MRATDWVNNTGGWQAAGPVVIQSVTKYYSLGSSRVAMRQGDVVYYLHGDHLGSVSLTTDESGAVEAQSRYLPYGQERWSSGSSPTDFGFTGQREEAGFAEGMDYNARYYSPGVGRFVSPDTLVPDPTNPQLLNRYSYVRNNPVRYSDPTGHCDSYACEMMADNMLGGGGGAGTPIRVSEGTGGGVGAVLGVLAVVLAIRMGVDVVQGVNQESVPLAPPAEGLTESVPLPPADPAVYNPGPTLGEVEVTPVLPGSPIGVEKPNTVLDFPMPNIQLPTVMEARSNTLRPDPSAVGPHSVFRRDPVTGQISNYQTFVPQTNPQNPTPWESTLRFRGSGIEHYNKVIGEYVAPPLVHDPHTPGHVRKPELDELPGGY